MLRRLRQLPPAERGDLFPALWHLLVARGLLFFGIQRAARWLGGSAKAGIELESALWQRRALALKRVGSRLPGVACLSRALALRWWMRRHGLAADMVIGVATARNDPESHAWVEVNGKPVDEPAATVQRFRKIQHF